MRRYADKHANGQKLRHSIFAYAGEIGGEVVGIGGLSYERGDVIAFADLTDAVRRHPVALHRIATAVLAEARRRGHRHLYATADKNVEAAERWLTRLGFVRHEDRNLWQWQPPPLSR